MEKLTLDTNSWCDWAWSTGKISDTRHNNDESKRQIFAQCFSKLEALRASGRCEIASPLQMFIDFQKSEYKLPLDLSEFIKSTIDREITAIMTFPIVFPLSFIPSGMDDEVFSLVFPDSKPGHNKYESNHKDITLLCAHIIAKQNVFITSDKAILRASAKLKAKYGTEAKSVCEYVA